MSDEMKPLSKITGKLIREFVKRPAVMPVEKKLPPIPPFDGLRFYIAHSKYSSAVSLVWVDNDPACHKHHETEDDGKWRKTDWHSYSGYDDYYKRWYPYAIRCPMSIAAGTVLEFNTPSGHAQARLESERKHARDGQKAKGVTAEDME